MSANVVRFGVVSDLHHDPQPSRPRSWIGPYDPAGLLQRLDEALGWFVEEAVDAVIIVGDLVETPDIHAYDEVMGRVASSGLVVGAVGGNHDFDATGLFQEKARAHGIALLDRERLPVSAVGGVAAAPTGSGPGFRALTSEVPEGSITVSHFPLLSEAERLAGAGLLYPGDLVNREQALGARIDGRSPSLVISGHIHARCSQAAGSLLQLSCAALIEPPYEASTLCVADGLSKVTRTSKPFRQASGYVPVFAPASEKWVWEPGGWRECT